MSSERCSLDELVRINSELRAKLELEFKNSKYDSKPVFLACSNVVEDLYSLSLTIQAAKAMYDVELLPFFSGITVKLVDK